LHMSAVPARGFSDASAPQAQPAILRSPAGAGKIEGKENEYI